MQERLNSVGLKSNLKEMIREILGVRNEEDEAEPSETCNRYNMMDLQARQKETEESKKM